MITLKIAILTVLLLVMLPHLLGVIGRLLLYVIGFGIILWFLLVLGGIVYFVVLPFLSGFYGVPMGPMP